MSKKYYSLAIASIALLIGSFALSSVWSAESTVAPERPRKKLIELGWDIPTTEFIAKHWREMEANAPFDGIVYDLAAASKKDVNWSSQHLFTPERWTREAFQQNIADLKSCDFQRYRQNFIRVNFSPSNFDWTDDEAWSAVCEKGAICAWVAKETNGEICLDFESYGAETFRFNATKGLTFEETKAIARRRGAEFCSAIVREYPEVVFLCLWMNSINFSGASSNNLDDYLIGAAYGLLPSFIDGMLDAVAPETTLVDGCEVGYYLNGAAEYDRTALKVVQTTGAGSAFVSPENLAKYHSQVQCGFGFYLDMYANPPGSMFYRGPEPGETRFDRLAANLNAAWNAADEYVWVYGEQKKWWNRDEAASDDDWTSWEEALPGITDLQESLIDPNGYLAKVKKSFEENSDAINLLANGDFSQRDADGHFVNWSTWMNEDTTGEFTEADGLPAIKGGDGPANACYINSIDVQPGARYFITGKVRQVGNMSAAFTARWSANGHWTAEPQDVRISPARGAEADADGFVEASGFVTVPSTADKLVLLAWAQGPGANSVATFKDVRIYRFK